MEIIDKLLNNKYLKWLILIAFIFIVTMFIVVRKEEDKFIVKNHDLYQYFNGFRVDYTGRITLNQKEDKITTISFDGDDSELDTTPLYYSDDDRVIFPKNMSVIYPLEGVQYKINYYSEAYVDFEEVIVKDKKKEKRLFNSIIYDGADLYFLTEYSTINFGDKSIKLSPLSYLIVDTYNSLVSVFDYESEKFTIYDNVLNNVIISNGKYKVNASLDLMYYDKTSKLFLKDISKLKNLPIKD